MKRQYANDIGNEYQTYYDQAAGELEGHEFVSWNQLDELERLDSLADFWFGVAERFTQIRKKNTP